MTCWYYNDHPVDEIPPETIGFVYVISDFINHKKYVGKKLARTTRKLPPLKGKKNRRHKTVDTDWRTYWGSNTALLAEIEKYGERNFRRDIIVWCSNKNSMSYHEAREQFERNVLLDDSYYNGIIAVKTTARGLKD